jgi:hypothetical protein
MNSSEVDGVATLMTNDAYIDLEIDFDDFNIRMLTRNLSVSVLDKKTSNIVMESVMPEISGFMPYRSYKVEFPTSFNFKNIELKMKYGDLPVDSESDLVLKKCSNYDMNTETCLGSWTDVSKTIDTTNKQIVATITSFSVYALGENEEGSSTSTTTTTTTSPTTTTTQSSQQQSSSSGSSSSGPSGGGAPPQSSSSTTSTTGSKNLTTTTTAKIITSNSSSTTTTANSNYLTSMSTSLQQNSTYLAVPAVAAAGFLFWRFYLTKKQISAPKFYKVGKRKPSKRTSHSYNETRLVLG